MKRLSNQSQILRAMLLLLSSLLPATAMSLTLQFSDGTFNLASYSISVFNNLPPPDTASLSQKPVGGNPGTWVAIDGTLQADPTSNAIYAAALVNSAWSYSPANQGPITSVSFSLDRFNSVVAADTQVAATLVAVQSGIYYFNSIQGPVIAGVWETISQNGVNLTTAWNAFSFFTGAITPGVHPNFSSGSQIAFGFALSVQPPSLANTTGTVGADNFSLTISAVPEPKTALLFSAALALLIARHRPRRRARSAA